MKNDSILRVQMPACESYVDVDASVANACAQMVLFHRFIAFHGLYSFFFLGFCRPLENKLKNGMAVMLL